MKFKKSHLIGVFFTIIIGTLLHFLYQWSGENSLIAPFSAVNESTWEHLKLLVIPMLIFAIFEYLTYGKEFDNFIPIRFLSILLGMLVIITVFYTYTGIIGQNYLIADILTFVLGVLSAYLFSYQLLQTDKFSSKAAIITGWFGLILIIICFVIFTFYPPHLSLFQDPITGNYGTM